MKIPNFKLKMDERGFTLVELLASFVLITLLLTTFLMMFAQAAKTNVASETIIDSTYTAQTEMEKIYAVSKRPLDSTRIAAIENLGYTKVGTDSIWLKFKKKSLNENEEINIRLENKDEKMTRIIIEVYEGTKPNPSAKMENVLIWEGT